MRNITRGEATACGRKRGKQPPDPLLLPPRPRGHLGGQGFHRQHGSCRGSVLLQDARYKQDQKPSPIWDAGPGLRRKPTNWGPLFQQADVYLQSQPAPLV